MGPRSTCFSFGSGEDGRLGLGTGLEKTATYPRHLDMTFVDDECVSVFAGGNHSALLTVNGSLFTWGLGIDGQLGHGNTDSYYSPAEVEDLKEKVIVDVGCGWSHTAAVTSDGELYTWGCGADGRLGHGSTSSTPYPSKVSALANLRITSVACGHTHTVCVSSAGEAFAWGLGTAGQLGLGSTHSQVLPKPILGFDNRFITAAACGWSHTLLLLASGEVFASGRGEDGQLGQQDRAPRVLFCPLTALKKTKIVQISAGDYHSAAIDDVGSCFTWGRGAEGQLGHGIKNMASLPRRISSLSSYVATMVMCGGCHTLVACGSQIHVFGHGFHGQLGNSSTKDRANPVLLDAANVRTRECLSLAGGNSHSLILVTSQPHSTVTPTPTRKPYQPPPKTPASPSDLFDSDPHLKELLQGLTDHELEGRKLMLPHTPVNPVPGSPGRAMAIKKGDRKVYLNRRITNRTKRLFGFTNRQLMRENIVSPVVPARKKNAKSKTPRRETANTPQPQRSRTTGGGLRGRASATDRRVQPPLYSETDDLVGKALESLEHRLRNVGLDSSAILSPHLQHMSASARSGVPKVVVTQGSTGPPTPASARSSGRAGGASGSASGTQSPGGSPLVGRSEDVVEENEDLRRQNILLEEALAEVHTNLKEIQMSPPSTGALHHTSPLARASPAATGSLMSLLASLESRYQRTLRSKQAEIAHLMAATVTGTGSPTTGQLRATHMGTPADELLLIAAQIDDLRKVLVLPQFIHAADDEEKDRIRRKLHQLEMHHARLKRRQEQTTQAALSPGVTQSHPVAPRSPVTQAIIDDHLHRDEPRSDNPDAHARNVDTVAASADAHAHAISDIADYLSGGDFDRKHELETMLRDLQSRSGGDPKLLFQHLRTRLSGSYSVGDERVAPPSPGTVHRLCVEGSPSAPKSPAKEVLRAIWRSQRCPDCDSPVGGKGCGTVGCNGNPYGDGLLDDDADFATMESLPSPAHSPSPHHTSGSHPHSPSPEPYPGENGHAEGGAGEDADAGETLGEKEVSRSPNVHSQREIKAKIAGLTHERNALQERVRQLELKKRSEHGGGGDGGVPVGEEEMDSAKKMTLSLERKADSLASESEKLLKRFEEKTYNQSDRISVLKRQLYEIVAEGKIGTDEELELQESLQQLEAERSDTLEHLRVMQEIHRASLIEREQLNEKLRNALLQLETDFRESLSGQDDLHRTVQLLEHQYAKAIDERDSAKQEAAELQEAVQQLESQMMVYISKNR